MLKIDRNKHYFWIAVYAFFVMAALVLTAALVLRFQTILRVLTTFLSFLKPVLFGFVIAYLCNPIMKKIEKHVFLFVKKPLLRRALSIALSYILVLLFIALILYLVFPQIVGNFDRLVDSLISLFNTAADIFNKTFLDMQKRFGFTSDFELTFETLIDLIGSFGSSDTLSTLPLTLINGIVTALLSLFFSICILFHKESLSLAAKKIFALFLPHKAYRFFMKSVKSADRTFGRYFLGQIFDSIILGIVVFVILWIVHLFTGKMSYYALISVLVAVTNVIPYFGPFIGAIPSAIIVLSESVPMMFVFVIIILILQQVEGNIINPAIVGKAVGLDSIWVVIAIIIMGEILGIVGMIVGVPIFSIFYTAVKGVVEHRLKKKNLPTKTSAYEHAFSTGESPFAAIAEQAQATDESEEEEDGSLPPPITDAFVNDIIENTSKEV